MFVRILLFFYLGIGVSFGQINLPTSPNTPPSSTTQAVSNTLYKQWWQYGLALKEIAESQNIEIVQLKNRITELENSPVVSNEEKYVEITWRWVDGHGRDTVYYEHSKPINKEQWESLPPVWWDSKEPPPDVPPPDVPLVALSQSGWSLHYVDSEEIYRRAIHAFDGNSATFWHTQWSTGVVFPHPHELQINLASSYQIGGFTYLPRQDDSVNGNIAGYEFYISTDGINWNDPIITGTFLNSKDLKRVVFTPKIGRYIRLRSLSEVNNGPWATIAEINILVKSL